MMRRLFFSFLFLFISACQSPPSMFYQRSEYRVQRVGGLVVSTSPKFSRQEFISTENEILVEESWIAQNIDTKPIDLLLSKADAKIKDKSYHLTCNEEKQNTNIIKIAPGEKVLFRCQWYFPKKPATTSDLWVTFYVPTSSGDPITSSKLIRAEDFQ
jgi:hypothetical protein